MKLILIETENATEQDIEALKEMRKKTKDPLEKTIISLAINKIGRHNAKGNEEIVLSLQHILLRVEFEFWVLCFCL